MMTMTMMIMTMFIVVEAVVPFIHYDVDDGDDDDVHNGRKHQKY